MSRNNVAFMTPRMENPFMRIKIGRLLTPQGSERLGLCMGERVQVEHRGRTYTQAKKNNSETLWISQDSRPIIEGGLLRAASIHHIHGGGKMLCTPDNDGTFIVETMSGMTGDRNAWFVEIGENAREGKLPLAHGWFALDEGSTLEAAHEDVVPVSGKATRVKWHRDSQHAADGVRAQNWDLWRMQPGSQIIGADIFDPTMIARLVLETKDGRGFLRRVDGGKNARAKFEELEAGRRAARQAEMERRQKAREEKEAEAARAAEAAEGEGEEV